MTSVAMRGNPGGLYHAEHLCHSFQSRDGTGEGFSGEENVRIDDRQRDLLPRLGRPSMILTRPNIVRLARAPTR